MSPWLPRGECTYTEGGRQCREKVPTGRSRCRAHTNRGIRRSVPRPLPPDWKEIRLRILERDDLCVNASRCFNLSTTVDHIIDRADGGSDDDDNLQGMCTSCHNSKTARTRGFAKGKQR